MKYLIIALTFCFIGYVHSSLSVQEVIDRIFVNIKNKEDAIENNAGLVDHIYQYFQEKYPRQNSGRMIDSQRMEIFKSNLKYVIRHNEDPTVTYKLKINEFSDWTDDERDALRTKLTVEPLDTQPIQSRDDTVIPSEFDWTNQTRVPGAVTPVKDQRHCGSCYAFGVVGSLEKTYAEIYKQAGPLSPQELIDCSGQGGCEGGNFLPSFRYIQRNGFKLTLEKDYPSTPDGKNQTCQNRTGVSLSFNATRPLRYEQIPNGDEEYMKKVVYERGPVFIVFNCGERKGNDTMLRDVSNKFDHYASGIFDVPGCPSYYNLNHAPVVVGYGTENGTDYWKVKNSWGAGWGDNGYLKVKRGENMCGIATSTYSAGIF